MPDAPAPLLSIEDLHAWYGESHILHGVNFDVRQGEVVTLLGRNGAGKSSTFKSILGIVSPSSGAIRFDGKTISGSSPERIARMGIGLVPQGRRLFAGLTVEENLKLGALARRTGAGVIWDRDRIFTYFPRVREKLQTKADQLSGGNRPLFLRTLAASYAEAIGARTIFIGANAVDYSGYPDCRPEFIRAYQGMLSKGLKSSIEGNKSIKVQTPLITLSKALIVKLAVKLKVPLHLTWSCYSGKAKACGVCDSCRLRAKGFEEARIKDAAL